MIRLINPVLHTKYLDTRAIRSAYLWWTERPTIDKNKAFLQFETWHARRANFDTIWKYPCFHLARSDMDQILTQAPWITPRVCQYQTEPILIKGYNVSDAFTSLQCLLPKNPL